MQYERLLADAARAEQAGRRAEALAAYLEVAHGTGRVAEAREALLRAGLLRVAADDVVGGARLVREAAALHPAGLEPLELVAVQALLARLDTAERGAAVRARDVTAREEELRALRRTVATLRTQLEKRGEALRKAAEAAVGDAPPR